MDVPFTKINLFLFYTYALLAPLNLKKQKLKGIEVNSLHKILGAILYNTSSSIIFSYQSMRFLYPKQANYFIEEIKKRYNISRFLFETIDFSIHTFPWLFLIAYKNHWIKSSKYSFVPTFSILLHLLWIKLVPKHYNLNRIYMFGNNAHGQLGIGSTTASTIPSFFAFFARSCLPVKIRSKEGSKPIKRGRRCVPPEPGSKPS